MPNERKSHKNNSTGRGSKAPAIEATNTSGHEGSLAPLAGEIKNLAETYQASQAINAKYEAKHICIQTFIAIFTFLAFGAAAVYAYVAQQTLLEIKKSSDENIRVTREAYAALVVPSFGFDGNSGTMNVTFHNKGKSIVDVVASYEIEQISWPDAKQVYGSGVKGEIKDVRTPIDQAPSHYVFLPNFGDENFARYSKSTEVIRVKGTFRYSSAFGDDVSKDFCYINRAFAQAYSCADSIRDFPRNALQK